MILCDIGNTTATFYENRRIWSMDIATFSAFVPDEPIYFISVNDALKDRLQPPNYIDLAPFFRFNTTYIGLGVDRIAACYDVDSGLIVDCGSAITLDIMHNGLHLGGVILSGLSASQNALKSISPRLDLPLNTATPLDCLPQKTGDAISYGIIKPIISLIKELACERPIYFTGGDGEFLSRHFSHAIFDRALVFRGMQKVISQNKDRLC